MKILICPNIIMLLSQSIRSADFAVTSVRSKPWKWLRSKPSPTNPFGLGPSSPAVRERSLESNALGTLSRTAGEGAERSKAGEGLPATPF
jgi:hypothetical protein